MLAQRQQGLEISCSLENWCHHLHATQQECKVFAEAMHAGFTPDLRDSSLADGAERERIHNLIARLG